MTIEIPTIWVLTVSWTISLLWWAVMVTAILFLGWLSVQLLRFLMQNRKVYGTAIVWLTLKHYRDDAEKYNWLVFHRIAELLKKSNPTLFKEVGELFKEETVLEETIET